MTTMYRASTIGMEVGEIHCKSLTDKTVTTESGRRTNRDGGWYYICETEKAAIEWLKSIYENRVKLEEAHLEKAKYELMRFAAKYGDIA